MGLVRVSDCRFLNDGQQAQRSAREQLKFIIAHLDKLSKIIHGAKYCQSAKELNMLKENFTPNQLSYIDVIYEKTMKGLGFDSFTTTYKR